MIYIDSETCGLTGPMVLLQWAEDDGEIKLHHIWNEKISSTLELLEYLCRHSGGICGFNLSFDWFHVNKIYNVFRVFADNGYSGIPTISAVAKVEAVAPATWCLKPQAPLDLMLYARRTAYQHTMGRKRIILRKIPTIIAPRLAALLKEQVPLPAIAFARSKSGYRWEIEPSKNKEGQPLAGLSNVFLRFAGSSSLRALAHDCLGEDKADWPLNLQPTECAWHPYGQHGKRPWAKVISAHIAMWATNEKAQYYAWKDVDLTRKLHKHFGNQPGGDTDSTLACAIGATRWRGFEIDHSKIESFIRKYTSVAASSPKAPHIVLRMLKEAASPVEAMVIQNTRKDTLIELSKNGSTERLRSVALGVRAARQARYRLGLVNRLKMLPRLHPDFKVIGTKSNRQSGGSDASGVAKGSINPQGIPKGELRSLFTMADLTAGEVLSGGDAKSYEVTIIDAVFSDKNLHADLEAGKNFHALMGQIWYGIKYEDMMLFKEQEDTGKAAITKYAQSKAGDFAFFYGAQEDKMASVLEVDDARDSMARFRERYGELYAKREQVAMQFCSMRQPGGLGTKVIWAEPLEYVESLFGFRRYFTIENQICRTLFTIANSPKKVFNNEEIESCRAIKVVRRTDRGPQSGLGALQSSLYGAAFQLQAANMRAACNHKIQSPGGEICKEFQRALTDIQPVGIHHWHCRAFNMHDEILAVTRDDLFEKAQSVRDTVISHYRSFIPLLAWDWKRMGHWGDKGK